MNVFYRESKCAALVQGLCDTETYKSVCDSLSTKHNTFTSAIYYGMVEEESG